MWWGAFVTFTCGLTSSNSISQSERFPSWLGTPSNVTMNLGLTEFTISLLVRNKKHTTNNQTPFLMEWHPPNLHSTLCCTGNPFIAGVNWTGTVFGVCACIPWLDSAWNSRVNLLFGLNLFSCGRRCLQFWPTHDERTSIICLCLNTDTVNA